MDFKPFKMGKYLLMERLATGGMAEVYRARAQGAGGFEKQVAIKRILPSYSQNDEFRKMFEYEARLSSMLTHANIVQIFDFNKFGETYLLAMEYVDGKNLRQFVNKCRKVGVQFPVEFSVFVVNEVCKGLEYAHGKRDDLTGKMLNIIHRDMSPQNIMLSYEGAVKIVDFGIAKAKDRVDETRSGVIKGKFGYMSPEQANGQSVDHRTDIFSTGIILWELLTGRRLFAAESDLATLRMIQECVITPPSKINPRVPADLEKIVMKVLSKDLKLRYTSAGDLHRHLLEFLSKHAPTFTQREVSGILHKAFADEISKEKKRFEQLNRQSIPFSQGASKKRDEDDHNDVSDVLEGTQTRSDIAEPTADTFGDEEVAAPELSKVAELEGTQLSSSAISLGLDPEQSNVTKSEVGVPIENEDPSIGKESTAAGSSQISIVKEDQELDLVLPGGGKHAFNKQPSEGQAKLGLVVENAWEGAAILPMGVESEKKPTAEGTGTPVTIEAAEPGDTSPSRAGEVSTLGASAPIEKIIVAQPPTPTPAAKPFEIAKPTQFDRPDWGSRPMKDYRERPRPSKKRRFHPVLPLVALLVLTAYVYKLYWDGSVGEYLENSQLRDPTQNPTGVVDKPNVSDADSVSRKPVGECTLEVRSQPPGAMVRENKEERGLTPLVLSGPCHRSVNIELLKEGFEYLSENVVIGPKMTEWGRALKAIPMGNLILSLGFNANVLVNGEPVRDAKAQIPLTLPLRAKRTHRIRLINPTLKIDLETSVQIQEGQNTPIAFTLEEAIARSTSKPAQKSIR